MLVLIVVLVVSNVISLIYPGFLAQVRDHAEKRKQRLLNNLPGARRELLEWAAETAYYGVEQFRKTQMFAIAVEAADDLTRQDVLKKETLRRAKQLLLTVGVKVPDDGLLLGVLDTLVEQLIYRENQAKQPVKRQVQLVNPEESADSEMTDRIEVVLTATDEETRKAVEQAMEKHKVTLAEAASERQE